MKFALFIIILLLMSMFFVISENKLALRNEGSFDKLTSIYTDWAKKAVKNTGQITGNAIKLDWSPKE